MKVFARFEIPVLVGLTTAVLQGSTLGQTPDFREPTSSGRHAFTVVDARSLHRTNANLPARVFDLPDGGCLTTFYFSIKGVYGWTDDERVEFRKRVYRRARRSNQGPSINFAIRVMNEDYRLADPVHVIEHRGNRDSNRYAASVEGTVLDLARREGGVHFFGLAVNGGYHSVLLAVGQSRSTGAWEVYWFDQNTRGFTNRVTGRLDELVVSRRFKARYGWSDIELSHFRAR